MMYVLTGRKQSGKTTTLFEQIAKRKDVSGILQPIRDEKRVIYDNMSGESRVLEVKGDEEEVDVVRVGRFAFNRATMAWAGEVLLRATKAKCEWLVVDEIGPLELRGEGMDAVVKRVLMERVEGKMMLVVREGLVDDVLKWYEIPRDKVEVIGVEQVASVMGQ